MIASSHRLLEVPAQLFAKLQPGIEKAESSLPQRLRSELLVARLKRRQEAFTQKLDQLDGRVESQLLAGIDLFHPSFKAVLGRLGFCSQLKYESSAHNDVRLRRCRQEGVNSRWRFGLILVTGKAIPIGNIESKGPCTHR